MKISIIDITIKCWWKYQKQLIKMSTIEKVIIWQKYKFWQKYQIWHIYQFWQKCQFWQKYQIWQKDQFDTKINNIYLQLPHLLPLDDFGNSSMLYRNEIQTFATFNSCLKWTIRKTLTFCILVMRDILASMDGPFWVSAAKTTTICGYSY